MITTISSLTSRAVINTSAKKNEIHYSNNKNIQNFGRKIRRTTTESFLKNWKKKEEPLSNETDAEGKPKGLTAKGMSQLIKMGLGAVSGDITEINFDKENAARAVVMELEANNLEDAEGNPLSVKFMDNEGFVGGKDDSSSTVMNKIVPVVLGAGAIAGVVATLNAL